MSEAKCSEQKHGATRKTGQTIEESACISKMYSTQQSKVPKLPRNSKECMSKLKRRRIWSARLIFHWRNAASYLCDVVQHGNESVSGNHDPSAHLQKQDQVNSGELAVPFSAERTSLILAMIAVHGHILNEAIVHLHTHWWTRSGGGTRIYAKHSHA